MPRLFAGISFLFLFLPSSYAQQPDADRRDSLIFAAENAPTDTARADALVALSELSRPQDKEAALSYAEKAVDISTAADYLPGVAAGNRKKALALMHSGKYAESQPFFAIALENFTALSDSVQMSAVLTDLGLTEYFQGKNKTAVPFFDRAYRIDSLRKDTAALAVSHANYAMLYNRAGNIPKAIEHMEKTALLDSLTGDWKYFAEDLGGLAMIAQKTKDYKGAVGYAKRGLAMAEKNDSDRGRFINASVIGDAYIVLENYPQAYVYFDKALQAARKTGNAEHLGRAYNYLQVYYHKVKDSEKAKVYMDSALLFIPANMKTHVLNNAAVFYDFTENNPVKAAEYYRAAIAAAAAVDAPQTAIHALYNMAVLEYKAGNLPAALDFLDRFSLYRGEDEFSNYGDNKDKTIAEIYASAGNYRKAAEYYADYTSAQDSFIVSLKATQNELLDYENEIRDLQIKETKSRMNIAELQLRERRNFIIALVGFLLLALLAAVYYFRKKKQTEALNERLEYLNEAVHHKAKNDFLAAAGLIELQIKQTDAAAQKNLLRGVADRIGAMGDIYALLQPDSAEKHDRRLDNFLKNLLELRLAPLQHTRPEAVVTMQLDLPATAVISVGAARDLGLIVDEMLTNALKHGRQNAEQRGVYISIGKNAENSVFIKTENKTNKKPGAAKTGSGFGLKMIHFFCERRAWKFNRKDTATHKIFELTLDD